MLILLPITAALIAILITPGFLFYFDVTPKILVLLCGAAIALFLVKQNRRGVQALLADRLGRWFVILIAAQELSLVISTIFSRNPALSLNGGNWRRFGLITQSSLLIFILLAAGCLVTDARCLRWLLRAMAVSGMAIALYGVLQYFGIDPLLPASSYQVGEGVWTIVRPPGTLGHADYLGAYLLYVVFCGLAVALMEERGLWKWAGAGAALSAVMAIGLSGTRASILGLVVGVVTALLMLRPKLRLAYAGVALGFVAAVAGFYVSPAGEKLRARTRWYVEDPRGGARLWLWRDSARMAEERLLVGYGPETFTSEFPRFQSLELARAYPDFYHESPHNMFLDAATAQGLPGLFLSLGFCGVALLAAWRSRIVEPKVSATLAGALMAGVCNQQFVCFILPTAFFFYLVIAMLIGIRAKPVPGGEPVGRAIGSRVLCAGLAVILIVFGARLAWSDVALAAVQRNLDAGNLEGAIAAYRTVELSHPAGSSAALFYSRRMADFGRSSRMILVKLRASQESAMAAASAVQSAEDRPNAFYNAAEVSASREDAGGVERNLRAAIAAAPNWFKPHWVLAQFLVRQRKLAEAETEAAAAVERDGGKNPELTRTLEDIRRLRTVKR